MVSSTFSFYDHFSCLIFLASTSSTMSSIGGQNRHLLVLFLSGRMSLLDLSLLSTVSSADDAQTQQKPFRPFCLFDFLSLLTFCLIKPKCYYDHLTFLLESDSFSFCFIHCILGFYESLGFVIASISLLRFSAFKFHDNLSEVGAFSRWLL